MPKFNPQTIARNTPGRIAPKQNALGAVGAGLQQVSGALNIMEKLEADETRRQETAQAQAGVVPRSQRVDEQINELKTETLRTGNYAEHSTRANAIMADDLAKSVEGLSPHAANQWTVLNKMGDLNRSRSASSFAFNGAIKLNRDAYKSMGDGLSEAISLSEDEVTEYFDDMIDLGKSLGLPHREIVDGAEAALRTNYRGRILTPGAEEQGRELLDSNNSKALFSDQERQDILKKLNDQQDEQGARDIETNKREAFAKAGGLNSYLASPSPDFDTAMGMIESNTSLNDLERPVMKDHVRAMFGLTKAEAANRLRVEDIEINPLSIRDNITDSRSEVAALLSPGNKKEWAKKSNTERSEDIAVILDKATVSYNEAIQLHKEGVLPKDAFQRTSIEYHAFADLAFESMKPDIDKEPGAISGMINTLTFGLFGSQPSGVNDSMSISVQSLLNSIELRQGQYSKIGTEESNILVSAIQDYVVSNELLTKPLTPNEISEELENATNHATQRFDDIKMPGVPQEKRDRIKEAKEHEAVTATPTRPSDAEIDRVLSSDMSNEDQANWMSNQGMTPTEITDTLMNLIDITADVDGSVAGGGFGANLSDGFNIDAPVGADLSSPEEVGIGDIVKGVIDNGIGGLIKAAGKERVTSAVSDAISRLRKEIDIGGQLPVSDDNILQAWTKFYQGTNNPKKTARADKVIREFGEGDVPEDAQESISKAVSIFGGDMGVSAEELTRSLKLVGAIESDYNTKTQGGGGPARSYWQVEPATAKSILTHSGDLLGPKFRDEFGDPALLANLTNPQLQEKLLNDQDFAAAMAAAKMVISISKVSK